MINIDNVLAEQLVPIIISDVKKPFNEQPRVKVQGELDQMLIIRRILRYLIPALLHNPLYCK